MNRETKQLVAILLAGYNTLPLMLWLLPDPSGWGMLLSLASLYLVSGFLAFASGLVYSLRHGWTSWLPALVGALFVPTMLIFYNSSAITYLVGYMALAYFGMLLGSFGGRGLGDTRD